jgi:dihydroorotate dehydrogenase (fumarate)
MFDLSTTYMGLHLTNPIIAASSGLTGNLKDIIALEKAGAGAIVLKSLFEEEIVVELDKRMNKMHTENYLFPETISFYEDDNVDDTLTNYLKLVYEAKKHVEIPIIASINCTTPYNWPYFTKYLQEAGADGIELNIFMLPADSEVNGLHYEKNILDIVNAVLKEATIPVSIKISPYFSSLANTIVELSKTNIKGIVLFNRFFSPDYDIDNFEVVPASIFSNASDYTNTLRWVSITSPKCECDIAATTGIHDAKTVIKMLLAGAKAVQIASVLYNNGIEHLAEIKADLEKWMEETHMETIDQFRGKLNLANTDNPGGLLRVQFMKHFAGK